MFVQSKATSALSVAQHLACSGALYVSVFFQSLPQSISLDLSNYAVDPANNVMLNALRYLFICVYVLYIIYDV